MCIAFEYRWLWKPEENVKSHGTGVIGICESPDLAAKNQTQIL